MKTSKSWDKMSKKNKLEWKTTSYHQTKQNILFCNKNAFYLLQLHFSTQQTDSKYLKELNVEIFKFIWMNFSLNKYFLYIMNFYYVPSVVCLCPPSNCRHCYSHPPIPVYVRNIFKWDRVCRIAIHRQQSFIEEKRVK